MSIDSELRRAGASARDSVGAGLDVEARLAKLRATARRRSSARAVAVLVAAASAVVAFAGLVPLGSGRDPSVVDRDSLDSTVSCRQALADTFSPGGAVQCAGRRVVLVRGPVSYTFRLPRDVPWKIDSSGSPWAVHATMDPWSDTAGVNIMAGVRAAAGGEAGSAMSASELASWVASRRFLVATPVRSGMQDGLPTWTVQVRPRPGLPRPGPARACYGVDTDCHALLTWEQGSALNETGLQDGEALRLSFADVPGGGVVALLAYADFGSADSLDGAVELLGSVDFMFAVD